MPQQSERDSRGAAYANQNGGDFHEKAVEYQHLLQSFCMTTRAPSAQQALMFRENKKKKAELQIDSQHAVGIKGKIRKRQDLFLQQMPRG